MRLSITFMTNKIHAHFVFGDQQLMHRIEQFAAENDEVQSCFRILLRSTIRSLA